jgi:subtilisin family serine protease
VRVACELIRAVKQGGAQIVNLSVGCQTPDNVPPVALKAALEIVGEWERETGREVLIVAAAGNFGDTLRCWPAAFPGVVSVAALTPGLAGAPWSSSGPWVRCSTIGQGIYSTFVPGREDPKLDPAATVFGPDAFAVWSGTSFAAPQIAGALARLYEDGYPLREALQTLLAAGLPVPGYGQALKILPGI